MGTLPCLWKQNKVTDTDRYRAEKLSPLLSKMQAGEFDLQVTVIKSLEMKTQS